MPTLRYVAGLAIIGGGLTLSVAHHLILAPAFTDTTVGLMASVVPLILAIGAAVPLVAVVHTTEIERVHLVRGAGWYLGGGVVFAVAVILTLSATGRGTELRPGTWFSVANWAIGGSFIGLVVANYDLRRTRAIVQANASRQRADQVAQRLSVLNRVLRHDVRNKTNVILGYTQLLEDRPADRDAVVAIEDAATALTDIAERARLVRRIVEDESPCTVDLTELVDDLVGILQEEHPDARIEADLSYDTRAWTYSAIRTALWELLENTMDHNPQPEPDRVARVRLHSLTTPAGERVEVVIEDNGPGIPAREQLVVTDEQETQLEHSRGLSLWLARWIVDESGGEFTIETADVDGTRMSIRLPTAEAESS